MAGYEYTIIVGNVGRDPEMRYLQSGVAVCSFSVAVTTRWSDRNSNERREKTNWYRVSAWRGLAETCNTYVRKGMQIMVTGTCAATAYMGQDGQPRASLEITARDIQFLGGRDDNGQSGGGAGSGSGNYDEFAPPPSSMDDIPF